MAKSLTYARFSPQFADDPVTAAHVQYRNPVTGALSNRFVADLEPIRWDMPVMGQARTIRADTELRGVRIPAGSSIMVMFAGANRDTEVFAEPDRFDIEHGNAGQHLAFGRGGHFCIGDALARLEARVAVRTLFGRLPKMRLDAARPGVRRTRRVQGKPASLSIASASY